MSSELSYKAAAKAFKCRIPFVLYHLPGDDTVNFFAELKGQEDAEMARSGVRFEIGEWLQPYDKRLTILPTVDAERLLQLSEDDIEKAMGDEVEASVSEQRNEADLFCNYSLGPSISKADYLAAVGKIAGRCAVRNSKTVYSRLIIGENPTLDIAEASRRLFETFTNSFGFLYFTPQTGCWIGATPETLLSYDYASRKLSTMAFAGTRKNAGDEPWDEKNLRENLIVADYISEKFKTFGIDANISAPKNVIYGDIQHLQRNIVATLPGNMEFNEILDAINPTPALCGTPITEAIADIKELEQHQRGCYGGFVAIHIPGKTFRSFVNLRSAHISPEVNYQFELIVGGGIIAESSPATEWEETCAKASRLLSILSPLS
jgi:isochorismate synthase EntC